MYGIIYKATNKVNGKVYIGQTVREFDSRVKQHIRDANGVRNSHYVFHVAIRKYGAENFKFEILEEADSVEELNEKEMFWIEKTRSYIRYKDCNGYNMTIGGDGLGSGEHHPRYGTKISEETRKKIIENHADFSGKKNTFYGRKHTEESKKRMSESSKGKNLGNTNAKGKNLGEFNARARSIIQLSKDGVFIAEYKTGTDATLAVNGDLSSVIKVCRGTNKTHKGFKWMYKEDYEKITNTTQKIQIIV